jgi:hypothetical protein
MEEAIKLAGMFIDAVPFHYTGQQKEQTMVSLSMIYKDPIVIL